MTNLSRSVPVAALLLVVPLTLVACAKPRTPPPMPPILEGQRVMLLPVRATDPAGLDAELAFWLGEGAPTTDWVLPEELQRAVDRVAAWRVRLDAMPRVIGGARSRSPYVDDPTYGVLRQLGAMVDAMLALLPVSAQWVADAPTPTLELTVALLDVRGGQVLWLRTVRGDASGGGREGAAVAEALAQAMFPLHTAAPRDPD